MDRRPKTPNRNAEATRCSSARGEPTLSHAFERTSRLARAVITFAACGSLAAACSSNPDHPQGDLEPPLDAAAVGSDAQGAARDGSADGAARDGSADGAHRSDGELSGGNGDASTDGSASSAADAGEHSSGDANVDTAAPSDGAPRLDAAMSSEVAASPDAPLSSDGAAQNDRSMAEDSGLSIDATVPSHDGDASASSSADGAAVPPNEGGVCARVGEACGALATCCAGTACTDGADPHCATTCATDSQCQSSVPGCCKPVGSSNVRVCVDLGLCAP